MADYTENRQFEINFYMSAKVVSPKNVDLMQLVPESFKDSVMLQDFLDQCGQLVGTWMTAVDELDHLVDPYLVGEDYIVYLAGNLGLDLITDEETTLDEKRKQLLNAIAWIKTKGTYEALIAQSHSNNLTPRLTDYYVSNVYGDYDDFTTYVGFSADDSESWFVAKYPGGNPSGLDSTYYKTPHFGFEILLDRAYVLGSDSYLWSERLSTKCTSILDSNRPINTVPHPGILLTPVCSEDGEVYTTAYLVATAVHSDWTTARFNLDMVDDGDVVDTIGDLAIDDDTNQVVADVPAWYLDTGVTLDFASNPVLTAVQRWRLGTGNRGGSPGPGFVMETEVLSGTIDHIRIYTDRVEYEFEVPKAVVQAGISEMGLYTVADGLRVASTFPPIDKSDGFVLRVITTIYQGEVPV